MIMNIVNSYFLIMLEVPGFPSPSEECYLLNCQFVTSLGITLPTSGYMTGVHRRPYATRTPPNKLSKLHTNTYPHTYTHAHIRISKSEMARGKRSSDTLNPQAKRMREATPAVPSSPLRPIP